MSSEIANKLKVDNISEARQRITIKSKRKGKIQQL
jgi:hypothetical protein